METYIWSPDDEPECAISPDVADAVAFAKVRHTAASAHAHARTHTHTHTRHVMHSLTTAEHPGLGFPSRVCVMYVPSVVVTASSSEQLLSVLTLLPARFNAPRQVHGRGHRLLRTPCPAYCLLPLFVT